MTVARAGHGILRTTGQKSSKKVDLRNIDLHGLMFPWVSLSPIGGRAG